MAFVKGQPKLGGRTKGTPNKSTLLSVESILKKHDVNPIEELIKIAFDAKDNDKLELAKDCWKEIAKYSYPALKAVEASGELTLQPEGFIIAKA